ncbi:MAG: SRPBCC domain-containing protein [bacterium]|nr:SRPBCC domain-containing protein [bacterium]
MNTTTIALWLTLASSAALLPAQQRAPKTTPEAPIHSHTITTAEGYTLVQEVLIAAPIEKVWNAYVTSAGWTAWASPVAKIDLRPGGTIRTHYGHDAKIGDPGTNELRIVNFVPQRVLTLQAKKSAAWPEVMKRDAEHLMNVIVFDDLGKQGTRIWSYGVGYRKDPAYEKMLAFFHQANEKLFQKLIAWAERGERSKHGRK